MRIDTPQPVPPSSLPLPISEFMQPVLDEMEVVSGRRRGIATGFVDLDRLTSGVVAGSLWVVAGRSGVGKSVLALDLARSSAVRQAANTLLISTTEPPEAIVRRLFAAEARLPLHGMTEGTLSDDHWSRLARHMGELAEAPLSLVTLASVDLASVGACMSAVQPHDQRTVQLLIIDALPADARQPETLVALRELARARQMGIVVVVHEDVGRVDVQMRRIEQVADVVLQIHRDDQIDVWSARAGEADLLVRRHRHGPQAVVVVAFQGHYGRFVDITV